MDFISIHAPDLRKFKNDKKEMHTVFLELDHLYKSVNADCIVFHIDSIKDFNLSMPSPVFADNQTSGQLPLPLFERVEISAF